MPSALLTELPTSIRGISSQYSQIQKKVGEKWAKEKGELPRPRCFHNGIILIVNS